MYETQDAVDCYIMETFFVNTMRNNHKAKSVQSVFETSYRPAFIKHNPRQSTVLTWPCEING